MGVRRCEACPPEPVAVFDRDAAKIKPGDTTDPASELYDAGHFLSGSSRRARAVVLWLWLTAFLVFLIVIVGGATRLTDSGLSITEWHPVTGVIPPLSETAWLAELEKYRGTTEYELINKGFGLADFKFIYWWNGAIACLAASSAL